MKLVKIKDVRVGQIWKIHNMLGVIELINSTYLSLTSIARIALFPGGEPETESIFNIIEKHELIGFLGITHEIKDNELVEIQQEDLIVNDVVEYIDFDGFKVTAVICAIVTYRNADDIHYVFVTEVGESDNTMLLESEEIGEDTGIFTYTPKKIGVLGVTHEFVNERLVK